MSIPFQQESSFRVWLERAVRNDEHVDWSNQVIDYAAFKVMLKDMARRRTRVRKMLKESSDGRLSHLVLQEVLAEPLAVPTHYNKTTTNNVDNSNTISMNPEAANHRTSHMSIAREMNSNREVFPTRDFSSNKARTLVGGCATAPMMEDMLASPYHAMMDSQLDISASSDADSATSHPGDLQKGKRRSKRTTLRKISSYERSEVIVFLQREMDKVQMFYHSQWQSLSSKLEMLTGNGEHPISAAWAENAAEYLSPSSDSELLGEEILELLSFCVINIVTACQILIRYDAYARTFEGTPMLEYFMKQVLQNPTSFRKILHHEELVALADSYQHYFDKPVDVVEGDKVDYEEEEIEANATDLSSFGSQRKMFNSIVSSTYSAQSVSVTGHTDISDSFRKTLRSWIEIGAYEDRLGLEPAFLTMRGKSLVDEMKQLADWQHRKQRDQNAVLPPTTPTKAKLNGMQIFNLTLNLISAFLYCMNYYIVEPSSTMYVNRLGAHDAMSGQLIGMMPLAAFCSSIPYSMWTNYSFRHPFIMSCFLMVVGNLLYSLADQFRSVEVALLGRFIAGLGAPKCVIRRYMADTTPLSLRTSVNASFGMVVAAGSAMGPAMAVLLNNVEVVAIVPVLKMVSLNGLTMPGYFMAALWATFLGIVLSTFEEPDREGLKEQQKLEESRTGKVPDTIMDDQTVASGEAGPRHLEAQELQDIFSSDTFQQTPASAQTLGRGFHRTFSGEITIDLQTSTSCETKPEGWFSKPRRWYKNIAGFLDQITFPVRICLGLLFAKVFTIEALVSATSALSKNRYHWQVRQVGTLGFLNGCLVIPFSILVGRLSLSLQDQKLMRYLVSIGCFGMFLLIDFSDLVDTPTEDYNKNHPLSVGPKRYISGYFLSYLSIQAFEGVIGSTLSKVIPTSLASGTFNSGLLATLVDTLGRACGDMFISSMGFINLRLLMNLLFIPGFFIMATCLVIIERYRDLLAV